MYKISIENHELVFFDNLDSFTIVQVRTFCVSNVIFVFLIRCSSANYTRADRRVLSTKYRARVASSYITVHTLRDAQDHSLIKVNCYRIIKTREKERN